MTSGTYHVRSGSLRQVLDQTPARVKRPVPRHPTTAIERFLLMAAIVLLPLQDLLPVVAGFSSMFILFAVIASYILLNRLSSLRRTWLHPVFMAAYILLAVAFLIEFLHPYSSPFEVFRLGQMIVGAIFVASLCRDRRALRWGIYGYLIAGAGISVFLFLTSYGALRGAVATNFQEASQIRSRVVVHNDLETNANLLGIIAAQGAVVALTLALTAKSSRQRALFFVLTSFCLVATFLPMSRSGIAILIISSAIVMFAYGIRVKIVVIAVLLGAAILIWVPEAVFARLTFSTEMSRGGHVEARARIYSAALAHLPEYVMTGVGAGNFWGPWGEQSQFAKHVKGVIRGVTGPHNWFAAVTIYWGLAGLLVLMVVLYQAYRCLPKRCGADVLSLSLLGIAVSLFLTMLVSHRLAGKEFSLGFGLLVAARSWIWPTGIVPLAPPQQRSFNAIGTLMKQASHSVRHTAPSQPYARLPRRRPTECS